MVPFRVLSRTNLAHHPLYSSLNPGLFIRLQTLLHSQKSQLLWNQANPASFCKTPGVGVPVQERVRCTEAQKRLFVSPLLATLTQTPGMGVPPLLQFPPRCHRVSVATQILFAVCFHILTNPFSRNPFCFTSMQIPRGCGVALSELRLPHQHSSLCWNQKRRGWRRGTSRWKYS